MPGDSKKIMADFGGFNVYEGRWEYLFACTV